MNRAAFLIPLICFAIVSCGSDGIDDAGQAACEVYENLMDGVDNGSVVGNDDLFEHLKLVQDEAGQSTDRVIRISATQMVTAMRLGFSAEVETGEPALVAEAEAIDAMTIAKFDFEERCGLL